MNRLLSSPVSRRLWGILSVHRSLGIPIHWHLGVVGLLLGGVSRHLNVVVDLGGSVRPGARARTRTRARSRGR